MAGKPRPPMTTMEVFKMNKNSCIGCGLYDPDYGCMAEHEWDCPQSDAPLPWEEVSGND